MARCLWVAATGNGTTSTIREHKLGFARRRRSADSQRRFACHVLHEAYTDPAGTSYTTKLVYGGGEVRAAQQSEGMRHVASRTDRGEKNLRDSRVGRMPRWGRIDASMGFTSTFRSLMRHERLRVWSCQVTCTMHVTKYQHECAANLTFRAEAPAWVRPEVALLFPSSVSCSPFAVSPSLRALLAHLQNPLVLVRDTLPIHLTFGRPPFGDGLQECPKLPRWNALKGEHISGHRIHAALIQAEGIAEILSRMTIAEPSPASADQGLTGSDVVQAHSRFEQVQGGFLAGNRLVPDQQPDNGEGGVALVFRQELHDPVEAVSDRTVPLHADCFAVYKVKGGRNDRGLLDVVVREDQLVVGHVAQCEHGVEDRTEPISCAVTGWGSARAHLAAIKWIFFIRKRRRSLEMRLKSESLDW